MELDWTRQKGQIELLLDEIAALVAGSGVRVVRAELIREGLANTNYKVWSEDGTAFHLRISQRDPATERLQIALAKRLAESVPVPKVLFYDPDSHVLLQEWMPGETMQRVLARDGYDAARPAARSLGSALGRIAQVRFPAAGFLTPEVQVKDAWPSVYEGLRGFLEMGLNGDRTGERIDAMTLVRIADLWDGNEQELRAATGNPCLSHADYKPSNLLIEGDRVTGVLDWEFAHSGTWLLDAGQLLRYLGDRRQDFADQVRLGLREAGLVPAERWAWHARIIDLASLVDLMNRPAIGERQASDILGLIRQTLKSG